MWNNIHIDVPRGQLEGLPVGSLVRVAIKGRITGASEMQSDPESMSVSIEGEALLQPGSLDDAMTVAMQKISNRLQPPDFVMGQEELHAP